MNLTRADYLRAKIAKAQRELDSGPLSVAPKTGPNLLIAVPSHSGELKYKTALSLISLIERFRLSGVRFELDIKPGCPLVTVVRNYFANKAGYDVDKDGNRFSHLLMIDSDLAGFEEGVVKLLEANKPVSALMFTCKQVSWNRIAHAATVGVPPGALPEFGGVPDINDSRSFDVTVLNPVRHIGTGVMLVQADVFRTLAEKNPEWKYLVRTSYFFGQPNPDREFQYDFFQTRIDPATKNYVSEDFFFCDEVHKAGYEIFALASQRTIHTGSYDFVLNLPAIASLGSAP